MTSCKDVFLRLQRGLRDEERFTSWLYQIARSSVAEHLRAPTRYAPPAALLGLQLGLQLAGMLGPRYMNSGDGRSGRRSWISTTAQVQVKPAPTPINKQ